MTPRSRSVVRALLGLAVVVALVVLIGPRGQDGPPLDPRSTGPLGTRGILEVVERLGGEVRVAAGAPRADGDAVALVITDVLSPAQRRDLRDWVEEGGRLVLADPFSELAPDLVGLTSVAFTEPSIEPRCDDPVAAGVDRVAVSGGSVFAVPPGGTGCFPRNDGFFLTRTPAGRGEVIALGGPATLTNQLLDQQDTAVLLVNLLLPADGGAVHVLLPEDPASEPTALEDVLPDQVRGALWQLPLAWLALVWWRARRHGRPVEEASPVRIEASETTAAVGALLHTAGRAEDAAAIVRARVHAELSRRLGIPGDGDPEVFLAVAAERTDLAPDVLRRLLLAPLPQDDDALIRYTRTAADVLAGIRQRTSPAGGPPAAATAGPTRPPTSPTTGATRP